MLTFNVVMLFGMKFHEAMQPTLKFVTYQKLCHFFDHAVYYPFSLVRMEASSPHCHLRVSSYVCENSSLALIPQLMSSSFYVYFR